MSRLAEEHCRPLPPGTPPLSPAEASARLAELDGWQLRDGALEKEYRCRRYAETLWLANQIAWLAEQEDHHPTLTIDYDRLRVRYTTHSVGGLSRNDFICAAKLDRLFRSGPDGV